MFYAQSTGAVISGRSETDNHQKQLIATSESWLTSDRQQPLETTDCHQTSDCHQRQLTVISDSWLPSETTDCHQTSNCHQRQLTIIQLAAIRQLPSDIRLPSDNWLPSDRQQAHEIIDLSESWLPPDRQQPSYSSHQRHTTATRSSWLTSDSWLP